MKQAACYVLFFVTLLFAAPALAADPAGAPAAHGAASTTHTGDEHPRVPHDSSAWAGTMLIIIAAMFLMAAVIGPIVRAEMPEEIAPAHGHDEHQGHGHGH